VLNVFVIFMRGIKLEIYISIGFEFIIDDLKLWCAYVQCKCYHFMFLKHLSFCVSRTFEHPPFVDLCVNLEFFHVICLVLPHVHLVFMQHPPHPTPCWFLCTLCWFFLILLCFFVFVFCLFVFISYFCKALPRSFLRSFHVSTWTFEHLPLIPLWFWCSSHVFF
jgi:hypothetical protein